MYSIFFDVSMAGLVVAAAVLGFKFLKPYTRVEAYKAAYYLGKLRQHAVENKVDIDKEVVNVLMSEEKFIKSMNPAEQADSYVDSVDKVFSKKENKK